MGKDDGRLLTAAKGEGSDAPTTPKGERASLGAGVTPTSIAPPTTTTRSEVMAVTLPRSPGEVEIPPVVALSDITTEIPRPKLPEHPANPEQHAMLASHLTFSWLSPAMARGAARPLEASDLFELLPKDETLHNSEKLAKGWDREMASGRRSSFHALRHAFGGYFWRTGLLKVINDLLLLSTPVLMRRVLMYLEGSGGGGDGSTPLRPQDAYLATAALLVASVLISLTMGQYFYRCARARAPERET